MSNKTLTAIVWDIKFKNVNAFLNIIKVLEKFEGNNTKRIK